MNERKGYALKEKLRRLHLKKPPTSLIVNCPWLCPYSCIPPALGLLFSSASATGLHLPDASLTQKSPSSMRREMSRYQGSRTGAGHWKTKDTPITKNTPPLAARVNIEMNYDIACFFFSEEKIILTKIRKFFWKYFDVVETGVSSCLGIFLWRFCIWNLQETCTKLIPITKTAQVDKKKSQNTVRHPSVSWFNVTYNKTHQLSYIGEKKFRLSGKSASLQLANSSVMMCIRFCSTETQRHYWCAHPFPYTTLTCKSITQNHFCHHEHKSDEVPLQRDFYNKHELRNCT